MGITGTPAVLPEWPSSKKAKITKPDIIRGTGSSYLGRIWRHKNDLETGVLEKRGMILFIGNFHGHAEKSQLY